MQGILMCALFFSNNDGFTIQNKPGFTIIIDYYIIGREGLYEKFTCYHNIFKKLLQPVEIRNPVQNAARGLLSPVHASSGSLRSRRLRLSS